MSLHAFLKHGVLPSLHSSPPHSSLLISAFSLIPFIHSFIQHNHYSPSSTPFLTLNFHTMVNFCNFVFVAIALSMTTVTSKRSMGAPRNVASVNLDPVFEPLLATRAHLTRKTIKSPMHKISNSSESTPTSVIPQKTTEKVRKTSERLERRTFGRVNFKLIQVFGYLEECLNSILPHTQIIRTLCAGEFGGDPERLGWDLVGKLRAILEALNICLAKIKDCGRAPTPSGLPGGRAPSMGDICQILFKIMCEIRTCCVLIASLCSRFSIIRQICDDTLCQITECLGSITIALGGEVGNVFSGLGALFGTIPGFFNVQFGFAAIPRILGASNGFFSFKAFL